MDTTDIAASAKPVRGAMLEKYGATMAILFVQIALVIGQIALIVLFVGHDKASKQEKPAIMPSMRALALENHELNTEVAHLKLEMEKRLYAAAKRDRAAKTAPAVPVIAPAPPTTPTSSETRARSNPRSNHLTAKSFITHAGQ